MRTRVVTVCRDERPTARSTTTEALEEWNAHPKEDLGGDTDVVCLDE